MIIRTFQPGDEFAQVTIYNEAAAQLPNFKPATIHEIARRITAKNFDPATRFYAVDGKQVVGYCQFQDNGRLSFPWCRKGFEHHAKPLFEQTILAMKNRNYPVAFAAYRRDWPSVVQFFEQHSFQKKREMLNFIQEVADMPTVPARPGCLVSAIARTDLPELMGLAPEALRVQSPTAFEQHLFENPFFSTDALFALRAKNNEILAVGILITESTFADPKLVDALMPCFRLGAFGTEGMPTKRVKGLFSFLAKNDSHLNSLGLDLLGQVSVRVRETDDVGTLAAQVPSDVPHLLQFYQRHFRPQGGFPVYERQLSH